MLEAMKMDEAHFAEARTPLGAVSPPNFELIFAPEPDCNPEVSRSAPNTLSNRG
jgi:hypothetical protein